MRAALLWISVLILTFLGSVKLLHIADREVHLDHELWGGHKTGIRPLGASFKLGQMVLSFDLSGRSGAGFIYYPESYEIKRGSRLPKLAIIIDDFGYDSSIAMKFISLPYKLTLSVLPNLPFSTFTAERAYRARREVLLHLPMQAYRHLVNPDVVSIGMSEDEVRRIVDRALLSVPHAVGVNNHMGSLATADASLMRKVMKVLSERGLFFIDSYTTPDTVAYHIAREMGIPSFYNSLFIDRYEGEAKVEEYIIRLSSIAKRRDVTIGIGHAKHETLSALSRFLPTIAKWVELVFVSDIVYRNGVVAR